MVSPGIVAARDPGLTPQILGPRGLLNFFAYGENGSCNLLGEATYVARIGRGAYSGKWPQGNGPGIIGLWPRRYQGSQLCPVRKASDNRFSLGEPECQRKPMPKWQRQALWLWAPGDHGATWCPLVCACGHIADPTGTGMGGNGPNP